LFRNQTESSDEPRERLRVASRPHPRTRDTPRHSPPTAAGCCGMCRRCRSHRRRSDSAAAVRTTRTAAGLCGSGRRGCAHSHRRQRRHRPRSRLATCPPSTRAHPCSTARPISSPPRSSSASLGRARTGAPRPHLAATQQYFTPSSPDSTTRPR